MYSRAFPQFARRKPHAPVCFLTAQPSWVQLGFWKTVRTSGYRPSQLLNKHMFEPISCRTEFLLGSPRIYFTKADHHKPPMLYEVLLPMILANGDVRKQTDEPWPQKEHKSDGEAWKGPNKIHSNCANTVDGCEIHFAPL